jgi:large subunit ribosomal protein L15
MKRAKNSRLRGSHTHGYGAKKKHRGKGSKGGAGMAGTGKRADVKKPVVWKATKYFGRHGFSFNAVKQGPAISIRGLETLLPELVTKGKASEASGAYTVDLKPLGYAKLIATGTASVAINVTVEKATERAVEKINAAGGSVTLTGTPKDVQTE